MQYPVIVQRAEESRLEGLVSWAAEPPAQRGLLLTLLGASALALLALLSVFAQSWLYAGVAVGAALWLGAAFLTARHPAWFACFVVFEELLPYVDFLPFSPRHRWFLRYPMLLTLAMPLAWRAVARGKIWQGGFAGLTIFYAWAAFSIAWSSVPAISAGRLVPVVILFAAFTAVTAEVESREQVDAIMARLLLGCAVMVGLEVGALLLLPGDLTWWLPQGMPDALPRFRGISDNPNVVGELMLVTVTAAVVSWPALGRLKPAAAPAMAASIVLAVLADSRSSFVALAVGLAAYLLWRWRLRGLLVCAVLAAAVLGGSSIARRGGRVEAYAMRDITTLTGRTEAWRFEIEALARSPLLGYGYASEGQVFQDRRFPQWESFWDQGAETSLHEGYLSIALGLGVPALLLWLYLTLRPFAAILRAGDDPWKLRLLVLLGALPVLVSSFAESAIGELRYPRGVMFALCWMIAERYRLSGLAGRACGESRAESGTTWAALLAGIESRR